MTDKWFVIRNPISGNGLGHKEWPIIEAEFRQQGIAYKAAKTRYHLHAIEIARNAVDEGFRKFIVIGGDGTLNEVANGILNQKEVPATELRLGLIPIGKGNDWASAMNLHGSYERLVSILKKGDTFLQDVGVINYQDDEAQKTRYFVSMAGCGFDGFVARKINEKVASGKKLTKVTYLLSIFRYMMGFKPVNLEYQVNGSVISNKVFSLAIGINKCNGGGMMQAPDAIMDDGYFDITVIRDFTKIEILFNIIRLYNGKFVRHRKVDQYRTEFMVLNAAEQVIIETDGESLGILPATIEILPRHLFAVHGKNFN